MGIEDELAFIVTVLIFICEVVFEDGSAVEDAATGKNFIEATEHRGTATRIFTADVDISCGLRNTDVDDDDDNVVVPRDDLR